MSKNPLVKPKTYRLFNVAFGTIFTLFAQDHSAVSGTAFDANGNTYQEITLQKIPQDEDLRSETNEYGQVVEAPWTGHLWRCSRLHRD
ncbi:hypothetical protein VTO73DRAFT_10317 [Trametes versicolor]